MAQPIISVEHLSKRYRIAHRGKGRSQYSTLREAIAGGAKSLVSSLNPGKRRPADSASSQEDFWALKDVSFDVQQGEVLGIIGRNGAGKSTLLKILSRITEPTEGRVTLRGRVASLLEVGTGFHPELTGRENVYLNGAILGMSRAEIKRKFDEIVDFAGVEKFLDTPVKRYSSGMYVRLAFAVAAHLEPEILIVDEVLAVGDSEFQKKCLGKMKDVSTKEGRTVLFVSHNLTAVKTLCKTGVLLEKGLLQTKGSSHEVLTRYLSSGAVESGCWKRAQKDRPKDGIHFDAVHLVDEQGNIKGEFNFDESVAIHIAATASRALDNVQLAVTVTDQEGYAVFSSCNNDEAKTFVPLAVGPLKYSIALPRAFLSPGRYFLRLGAHTPRVKIYDLIDNEVSFTIHETGRYAGMTPDGRTGVVNPLLQWRLGHAEMREAIRV